MEKNNNTIIVNDLIVTDRLQRIMRLACEVAMENDDAYLGAEHVLIGIMKEKLSVAANVITSFDITPEMVIARVHEYLKPGGDDDVDLKERIKQLEKRVAALEKNEK